MCNFKERKADISFVYKQASGVGLPMRIFLPDENVHRAKTVLCIHGGGWTDAVRDDSEWNGGWMENNAKFLAERGFVAVTASYRSIELSETLSAADSLEDCKDVVRYLRKHMSFINFSDITYFGDSAGGYFAVMMGFSPDDDIRPKTVAAMNPVLDGLGEKWDYAFKNADINALTPKNLIGDKCADFLFMHGTADSVADIKHTEQLNALLGEKGHKSCLKEIPDAEHAFILYDYKYPDDYVNDKMEIIIKYINGEN